MKPTAPIVNVYFLNMTKYQMGFSAESLLEQDPREETRNRFRLRRISEHADCELRVDPWRVFYRVQDKIVTVELIGQKKGNVLLIEGREFKL